MGYHIWILQTAATLIFRSGMPWWPDFASGLESEIGLLIFNENSNTF